MVYYRINFKLADGRIGQLDIDANSPVEAESILRLNFEEDGLIENIGYLIISTNILRGVRREESASESIERTADDFAYLFATNKVLFFAVIIILLTIVGFFIFYLSENDLINMRNPLDSNSNINDKKCEDMCSTYCVKNNAQFISGVFNETSKSCACQCR